MEASMKPRNQEEIECVRTMWIKIIKAKCSIEELAGGDVVLAATGVTDGGYLYGMRLSAPGKSIQSIVRRSNTCSLRVVNFIHDFKFKPSL